MELLTLLASVATLVQPTTQAPLPVAVTSVVAVREFNQHQKEEQIKAQIREALAKGGKR